MIDIEKIGINVSLRLRRVQSGRRYTKIEKTYSLKFWLYWKTKPYPENYIGCGIPTVSKKLGISLEEATKLIVLKLKEALKTVQDKDLKIAIENRLREQQ